MTNQLRGVGLIKAMTKQQELTEFLHLRIAGTRMVSPFRPWASTLPWSYPSYGYPIQRPTPEELAHELLSIAEFRALQLGTWLGTTDGQVLTQAVEMVAPPFYRQDVELLVEALKLAASIQQREGQEVAGKIALGGIGLSLLVAGVVAAVRASQADPSS